MKKVLITGINGFVGSHLAEALLGTVEEVWGTALGSRENISHLEGRIKVVEQNLLDRDGTADVVERVGADAVFHLAAIVNPVTSMENPEETLGTNIRATMNLFDAVCRATPQARVLNVSTGEVYGDPRDGTLPLKETAELRPLTPYALSKATQDLMGHTYWRRRNLCVIRCRPFSIIGPRQSIDFVAAAFARQIVEIELGVQRSRVMKVGNMDAERDFLDVRDVVAAYAILMLSGEADRVYNVCSGKPTSIWKILDVLLLKSKTSIELDEDPSKVRSRDTFSVYGDNSALTELGWSPRYRIDEALGDVFTYWHERVKKEKKEKAKKKGGG